MRALVTGAGGFIGRHVVQAFAAAGAQVRCHIGPPRSGLPVPDGAAETFEADIRDVEALHQYADQVDVVVHLAGPPSVAQSFADPCGYVRAHVEGTACVLEATRRARVPRLVYVSSAEIYGAPVSNPVDEDQPALPRSPYGAAKAAAETLIDAYRRCDDLRAVVLRPFSVYGPGASPHSLIGRILSQLQSGGDVVLEDLRPVRDYCFVSDVARAVVLACASRDADGVFNIGSMQGASVATVATLLIAAAGTHARVVEDASKRRPCDVLELVANNRRVKAQLGWEPDTELAEGLRSVWAASLACAS